MGYKVYYGVGIFFLILYPIVLLRGSESISEVVYLIAAISACSFALKDYFELENKASGQRRWRSFLIFIFSYVPYMSLFVVLLYTFVSPIATFMDKYLSNRITIEDFIVAFDLFAISTIFFLLGRQRKIQDLLLMDKNNKNEEI